MSRRLRVRETINRSALDCFHELTRMIAVMGFTAGVVVTASAAANRASAVSLVLVKLGLVGGIMSFPPSLIRHAELLAFFRPRGKTR